MCQHGSDFFMRQWNFFHSVDGVYWYDSPFLMKMLSPQVSEERFNLCEATAFK